MKATLKSNEVEQSTIRLVIVVRHRLDGDALTALFHAHAGFRVLCTSTSAEAASVVGQHRCPDVVLLDAGVVGCEGCQNMASCRHQIGEIPILLLDEELNNARLVVVLQTPLVGYFTRNAPFSELAEGIRRLARGERAFEPVVQRHISQTPTGWKLRQDERCSPLARLTPREIEVLRQIAQGSTVKDCAEALNLAPSTVDNHKARLMKKLGIHKSLDLTRLAIREGLIRL